MFGAALRPNRLTGIGRGVVSLLFFAALLCAAQAALHSSVHQGPRLVGARAAGPAEDSSDALSESDKIVI
jgi:hypothetical protein